MTKTVQLVTFGADLMDHGYQRIEVGRYRSRDFVSLHRARSIVTQPILVRRFVVAETFLKGRLKSRPVVTRELA